MKIPSRAVIAQLGWATGSYGVAQAFRLLTNVVLARLLAPQIFGVMLIVNTLRTGVELLSDVGIGQNIVTHAHAETQEFYSTAWTIQIIRGLIIGAVFALAAIPVSHIYDSALLAQIMPVFGLLLVITGFQSTSRFILQRNRDLKTITVFETIMAVISTVIHIVLAYFIPTVWALIYAAGLSNLAVTGLSFFMLPGHREKIRLNRTHVREIIFFGKWIFFSSIMYFLAVNFDRLYLASAVPFAVLGVYGVARSISEIFGTLINRVGSMVVFPAIASASRTRTALRAALTGSRKTLLLAAVMLLAPFVAGSDRLIYILYDSRYHGAGAMLPILAAGVWFTMLATLAEAILLGVGRPVYGAVSNAGKLVWLVVGLPLGIFYAGMIGVVTVIATSDLFRYVPLWFAQRRERLSFGRQDAALTALMAGLVVLWRQLFWMIGLTGSWADWWHAAMALKA